jgi:hypothetical protein
LIPLLPTTRPSFPISAVHPRATRLALQGPLMHSDHAPTLPFRTNNPTSHAAALHAKTMSELTERFVVRFPKGLRKRLEEAARLYRRSVNSEILARLEASLGGMPNQAFEDAVHPAFTEEVERMLRTGLSADELTLLRCFKRLSSGKRKALIDLLE